MCRVLTVSKAGYYAWRARGESKRERDDAALIPKVLEIHERSRRTYGSPRIHAELRRSGIRCARKRIARLMRKAEISGKSRGRRRIGKWPSKDAPIFRPNILDRKFRVDRPDAAWVADITYLPIRGRWLYLAVVIDLFSRRVVGWATDVDQGAQIAQRALLMALRNRKPNRTLVHSDRGPQYTATAYQELLAAHGLISSMSRTRNCWDNAVAETFFGSLKAELVPQRGWEDRRSADRAIAEYIELFYNHVRLHSYNNYLSPAAAEQARGAA